MTLAEFVARNKREVFDRLVKGENPETGIYDLAVLAEGRGKGSARMGASVVHPDRVELQFLFGTADPTIFVVTLTPPERIVFMPVPKWVVANVWQGEVLGSTQFESDARRLLAEFEALLSPDQNPEQFKDSMPVGRH
jgi:hypothetical protein